MESTKELVAAAMAMKEEGLITSDELSLLLEEIAAGRVMRAKKVSEIYGLYQKRVLSDEEICRLKEELFVPPAEPGAVTAQNTDAAPWEMPPAGETTAAEQRRKESRATVTTFSFIACLIGLLPLPVADAPLLILTQFFLMRKLCAKYGRKPGMGLVLIVVSAFLGPLVFSSFAKLLPGLGSILGACVGGGFTYLVGSTTAKILENNEEFTWENIKKSFGRDAVATGGK